MKADDPAFPVQHESTCCGLTKREYFAAMAMQGLIVKWDLDPAFIVRMSCELADDLIDKLSEGDGEG